MTWHIEITEIPTRDYEKRREKALSLLGEGLYKHLKSNGYLRKNAEKTQHVQAILKQSRQLRTSLHSENEGDSS